MPAAHAESVDLSALADALRGPLLRASRRLRQEAQKVGLSAQDALILGYIKKNPGVGVSELADVDQISRPTMSSHVKRLEATGWVSRTDNAEDGRRSGLNVTPAGVRKLDAIRRHRNDWLAKRLANLSPDERDRLAAAIEPLANLVSLDL
jgi:DNA-binding MarR family transcriptional regulator